MVLIGPQVCKWVKCNIFRLSYELTSHDLWLSFVTFDLMNIWRFLHYINKPINQVWFQSDFIFFKWGIFFILSPSYNLTSDDLWPWYMTFWLHEQRVPYCIIYPSLVPIRLQLFKWGHVHIFGLSYNLASDDLWPWHVTLDLINKCRFPCFTYDPTLVEIHQSMWKVEPNVNLFSLQQQRTTDNEVIPMYLSYWDRQHKNWGPHFCFFRAKCVLFCFFPHIFYTFIYLFIYNIRRHARQIQYWANNKLKDCLKKIRYWNEPRFSGAIWALCLNILWALTNPKGSPNFDPCL